MELVIPAEALEGTDLVEIYFVATGKRMGIADAPGVVTCSQEIAYRHIPRPPEPAPVEVEPYDRLSPAQKFEALRELTGTTPEQIVQQALTDLPTGQAGAGQI